MREKIASENNRSSWRKDFAEKGRNRKERSNALDKSSSEGKKKEN